MAEESIAEITFTETADSSEIMDYATHIAEVIGARPAGTEEEQQASFYIEQLLKENADLPTDIEEFKCSANFELPRVVCCIATVVLAILSIALPLTLVPALVLTIITGALFALDCFGITFFDKIAKNGVSQNVIGKYIPKSPEGAPISTRANRRKRKIVLIAHYDTGKVRAELKGPLFGSLNIIHWCEFGGMLLVPIALLIRLATTASEGLLIFLDVLVGIGALFAFLPVIAYVLHQTAQYNNGANCNAAGIAVMAEVARRIGREIPAIDFTSDVVMNGEEAARELLPEGASLTYDTEPEDATESPKARPNSIPLGSGVDAIFGEVAVDEGIASTQANAQMAQAASPSEQNAANAMPPTEEPVTFVGTGDAVAPAVGAAAAAAEEAEIAAGAQVASASDDNVPDWFKRGIAKAKENKPEDDHSPTLIQRSRFSDVLDNAAAEVAEAQSQANAANASKPSAVEERLAQMRASIMGQVAGAELTNAEKAAQYSVQNDLTAASAANVEGSASVSEVRDIDGATAVVEAQGTNVGNTQSVGVDGYLSSATEAPNYATEAAQNAAYANSVEAAAASAQAQISEQAKQAELEEAARVAEKAAIADRTIGFIPVAVDQAELSASEGMSEQMSILAQATGQIAPVAKDEAAEQNAGGTKQRKKREISLPSLTGAIEGLAAKLQDAPVAESAAGGLDASGEGAADDALASRKARQQSLAAAHAAMENAKSAQSTGAGKTGPISAQSKRTPSGSITRTATAAPRAQSDETGQTAGADRIRVGAKPIRSHATGATSGAAASTQVAARASRGEQDATMAMRPEDMELEETASVNVTAGAFIDASSTSSFQPVGDELLDSLADDEIYVNDADDSDFVDQFTSSGAPVGPGYVDMPKSRAGKMFSRFHRKKKKKNDEVSLKDSLGLDDSFDARSVGKARGGWESFRSEDFDDIDFGDSDYDSRDFDAFSDDDWNGGAFSRLKQSASDGISSIAHRSQSHDAPVNEDAEYQDEYYDEYGDPQGSYREGYSDYEEYPEYGEAFDERDASHGEGEEDAFLKRGRSRAPRGTDREERSSGRPDNGDASPTRRTRRRSASPFGDLPLDFSDNQMEEREVIEQFHSGALSTEVWFVALGAELANNAGVKELIAQHADELRGAVVIDLNGLGAGSLSVIEQEGMFSPVKVSSRLKRYANKAAASLGMHISSASMLWRDSGAYICSKHGYQALHIAGILNGKPAYSAEADDVIENVSADTLNKNADFVMELIRNI